MKSYIVRLDSAYENSSEWEKAFVTNNKLNNYVYMDPDNSSKLLYQDIAKYLNLQEDRIQGLTGKFVYTISLDPFGIQIQDDENNTWFLKSDQLGFSAIGGIYQAYIDKSDNKERARKRVSKWIFESRSIGGIFLWPMDWMNDGRWNSNPQYNKTRGTGRMQDRVDLTLLDIRNCFFKVKNSWLGKQYNERPYMKKWIDHFGEGEEGFNRYLEFFTFNSFIENGYPKDLVIEGNVVTDFWNDQYKSPLCEYKYKEIEGILSKLNTWIVERSNQIEAIMNEI
ncbi:MAG: hypothetical protein MJ134_06280 [Lachnospiraceae bacterium]|nr:hypothetical protein [Lachnospiraceae bacterium]